MPSEEWREQAACQRMPLSAFYGPDREEQRETRAQSTERFLSAASTCAGCPVREACLEAELARGLTAQHGFCGGMTARQRINLIRKRKARQLEEEPCPS